MAVRLTITAEDALRGKKVKPGWYVTEVVSVKEELNKAKDAMNVVIDLAGREGDAEGVPLRHYISEKATVFAVPMLAAFGIAVDAKTGSTVDFEALKGRKVKVKWNYDGEQKRNVADDWAPIAVSAAAAAPATGPVPGEF